MTDFLLVFRNDAKAMADIAARSAEQMQANMKLWMDWIGGIAAQNKLVTGGNRLGHSGKVIAPGNVVTDGPYTEIKEFVGGYSIIKADSYEDAVEMAKGCPILSVGGTVEVRDIIAM
jgi:hypothetical protein